MGAKLFFEGGDDSRGKVGELGFGEGGVAALERHADQQGVLPGGDVFAAEEVNGFDRSDFVNSESAKSAGYVREMRAVGQEQGKIALNGGKARDGLVLARFVDRANCGV